MPMVTLSWQLDVTQLHAHTGNTNTGMHHCSMLGVLLHMLKGPATHLVVSYCSSESFPYEVVRMATLVYMPAGIANQDTHLDLFRAVQLRRAGAICLQQQHILLLCDIAGVSLTSMLAVTACSSVAQQRMLLYACSLLLLLLSLLRLLLASAYPLQYAAGQLRHQMLVGLLLATGFGCCCSWAVCTHAMVAYFNSAVGTAVLKAPASCLNCSKPSVNSCLNKETTSRSSSRPHVVRTIQLLRQAPTHPANAGVPV